MKRIFCAALAAFALTPLAAEAQGLGPFQASVRPYDAGFWTVSTKDRRNSACRVVVYGGQVQVLVRELADGRYVFNVALANGGMYIAQVNKFTGWYRFGRSLDRLEIVTPANSH